MNSSNKEASNEPKTSKTKNKNYISSGNLFLDKLTGGLSLGSLAIIVEDSPSSIYESFLKYFIAEGVVNSQKCFFYYNNQTSYENIINNLPYKSTQVESILNAKRVNDSKSTEMKIAWRYENIKYSNILDEIIKSTDYIFDLSRHLQETYLIDKNKDILTKTLIENNQLECSGVEYLHALTQNIIKDYQIVTNDIQEDEIRIARFVVSNLFSDDCYAYSKDVTNEYINKIKLQLSVLKNVVRSINGVLVMTLNKDFLNEEIFKLIFYFSDYVFSLKSFIVDPQKLEDYDGLFYINKLPRICNMKTSSELETDTYGIIVEKRKIIIEKIDIGAEIDRNTKVKEKDLPASQAICGQEKYSKNYEF